MNKLVYIYQENTSFNFQFYRHSSCGNPILTIKRGSRGPNRANRNIVRQITKFGLIMYLKYLSIFEFDMHRKTLHKMIDFALSAGTS